MSENQTVVENISPIPWVLQGNKFLRRGALYGLIFIAWLILIWLITGGLTDPIWWNNWFRWDSSWYRQIFTSGYAFKNILVFPPLYPFIIGMLSKIFYSSFYSTAGIVNLCSYFCGLVVLSELLAKKFHVSPFWLFTFALSAPASYFAFTAYSDIIFFFLLWLLISYTLLGWGQAKAWAKYVYFALLIAVPLIRLVGFGLFAWILAKRWSVLLLIVPLGFWLLFNYHYTGDPFFFMKAQQLFGMPAGGFLDGLKGSYLSLYNPDPNIFSGGWNNWIATSVLPIFFLLLLLVTGILLVVKKQWLLALTLFSILVISFNQSYWRSVVRYELPLHGLIGVMLLDVSNKPKLNWLRPVFFLVLEFSFLAQLYFAVIFHNGGWAF